VRALPPSSAAGYASLSDDFTSALRSALHRAGLGPGAAHPRGDGR